MEDDGAVSHGDGKLGVSKVEVGTWTSQRCFSSRWTWNGPGVLTINREAKLIDLEFANKKMKKPKLVLYLAFKCVHRFIRNNREQKELFIELRYPPEVWNRGRRTDYPDSATPGACSQPESTLLGECRVMCVTLRKGLPRVVPVSLWRSKKGASANVVRVKPAEERKVKDSFSGIDDRLLYALDYLLSAGFLKMEDVTDGFLDRLRTCQGTDAIEAEAALYLLYRNHHRIYDLNRDFEGALQRQPSTDTPGVPKGSVLVRSAHVTPSRVLFFPPAEEQTNRILNSWKNATDQFLRVSFGEEDCSQLRMLDGMPAVMDRFRTLLEEGIRTPTDSRRFEFLAYSNSQLREHRCWFFSSSQEVSRDAILAKMGKISESGAARYASRMALWFSTGYSALKLQKRQTECVPDVERNGFIFSDGVGIISRATAKAIADKLNLNPVPSAFQIRYAGYKGVLSIDHTSKGGKFVKFRPSMKKFESDDQELVVLGWSRRKPGYLNHQVISIMSALGIEDEVFRKLHESTKDTLLRITKRKPPLVFLHGSDQAKMLGSGFRAEREPFLSACLRAIQKKKLQDLKMRARIYVPKSSTAMGVMDETGLLKPGQVFFRRSEQSGSKRVITGPVVVFKCPALAPGDVRSFEAVDCRMLHDLVDCLVFPQLGERPHPNELAGSDLDGDEYFISWDPDLIITKNAKAADWYTPDPSKRVASESKQVSQKDITDFFLQYIENDVLGQVANLHKKLADCSADGVKSPQCRKLAMLHSLAVDFAKTGEPVDIEEILDLSEMAPYENPDFMGVPPSYASKKILGQLYRSVKIEKQKPILQPHIDKDLSIDGYERYLDDARTLKKDYDRELKGIMHQFGVKSEAEAITGQVFKFSGQQEYGRKFFNVKSILRTRIKRLQGHYRAIFLQEFGLSADQPLPHIPSREMMQKAFAWYAVCYQHQDDDMKMASKKKKKKMKKKGCHDIMLSFAWIMCELLCQMKRAGRESDE